MRRFWAPFFIFSFFFVPGFAFALDIIQPYDTSGNDITLHNIINPTGGRSGTGNPHIWVYAGDYPSTASTPILGTSWSGSSSGNSIWVNSNDCTASGTDVTCDFALGSLFNATANFFWWVNPSDSSTKNTPTDFWIQVNDCNYTGCNNYDYIGLRWTGSGLTPPPATVTQITSISPQDGSTTASTAVNVTIGYDLTAADAAAGIDELAVLINNFITGAPGSPILVPVVAGSAQTYSTTTTLVSGQAYTIAAVLQSDQLDASGIPVSNQFYGSVSACNATAGAAQCLFAVSSNPLGAALGVNSLNPVDLFGYATSTCDALHLSGCIQNTLLFLFYPSPNALAQYNNAGNQIAHRAPMGDFLAIKSDVSNFSATGTASFTLATDYPITQYIFNPLVTALAGIIFALFGFWMFERLRHIQI
jgi:hypothetical protein